MQVHWRGITAQCTAALVKAEQGSCSALTSAAVYWRGITAQSDESQISIGVIAVAQSCFEPGLQSSTEQQRSCPAVTSAAVRWCRITAQLCEEQFSIGVIAMAQACCQPGCRAALNMGQLSCHQRPPLSPCSYLLGTERYCQHDIDSQGSALCSQVCRFVSISGSSVPV